MLRLDCGSPVTVSLDRGGRMVASMNKDRKTCRVAVILLLVMLLMNLNLDLTVYLQRVTLGALREQSGKSNQDSSPISSSHSQPHKVEELLDKLRETSRVAAGGHDYTLTNAERKAWHTQNPCQSRSELPALYAARKHIRDISSNPMWDQVLDEYANLHRICMKRVGNLSAHFLKSSDVPVSGCKFLLTEGNQGLGNKILVTVSSMLYAILSQRVILVPSSMTFQSVLCEPFVGSSWFLDAEAFPMPAAGERNNSWVQGPVFTQNLKDRLHSLKVEQEGEEHREGKLPSSLVDALVVSSMWSWHNWSPEKWFFCNTEQKYLSEVPWMYFAGCIYSIPDFFGSAPFSATLQALFPDKMVLTRMLRSTMLPSDSVWSRFKHLNHIYFHPGDRRVSIQLRFFGDSYDRMSTEINHRVMDCVHSNGILPLCQQHSTTDLLISPLPSAPITTVLIASLYSDLHNLFSEYYLRNPTINGEAVGVVQMTSRQVQTKGLEEDKEALVEMLLLSVSDSLIITPASTFGGMGQAYGGLTPWIVRVTPGDGVSCERAQTVDLCEHEVNLGYECPNDPPSRPVWTGLVGDCLKIDLGERIASGIQILDHNLSSEEVQEL